MIGGDATFAAPHTVNQTNNVTLHTQATDQRPLLLRQRVSIAKRIDAIAEAEGIASEAIYRVLLEDYGGDTTRDMARGHYRSIVADLDEWLDQVNGATEGPSVMRFPRRRRCGTNEITGPQRRAWLAPASVAALALVLSFLVNWSIAEEPPLHCHWNGKEFSIGAVTTMTVQNVYECIFSPDDQAAPYWIPARNLGGPARPHGG